MNLLLVTLNLFSSNFGHVKPKLVADHMDYVAATSILPHRETSNVWVAKYNKTAIISLKMWLDVMQCLDVMHSVLMTRIVNRLPCLDFAIVDIKARLTTSRSQGTTKPGSALYRVFSGSFRFWICSDVMKWRDVVVGKEKIQ